MPNSVSLLSYNDVKEILEKALANEKGITVELPTSAEAVRWLSRANSFRMLDRRNNKTLYQEGHTLHNCSVYDVLFMKRSGHLIEIKIRSNQNVRVVEL
jgi:hypothetical protein